METKTVIEIVMNVVVIIALSGIVPVAVQYAREKVKGKKVEEAVDIILDAVDQTNQTFADELRNSGTFTKEKQKEALQKSLTGALSMMNKRMIEFLGKEFNDAEAWIVSKIEAACKANKSDN
jgi:hypothetical protein